MFIFNFVGDNVERHLRNMINTIAVNCSIVFLYLKNLIIHTEIMVTAVLMSKSVNILIFGRHIGRHLENLMYYNIQNHFIEFLDPKT